MYEDLEYWETKKRNTIALVRVSFEYLTDNNKLNAESIYGLCQLTWITRSGDYKGDGYVRAAKLPGLQRIFGEELKSVDEEVLYSHFKSIGVTNPRKTARLVSKDTGFTNFRSTYRNSSRKWIGRNTPKLKSILVSAYQLKNDNDAEGAIRKLMSLPKVPSPEGDHTTWAEYLVTPLMFALDSRVRFPIMNGNHGVNSQYRYLGVRNSSTLEQYKALMETMVDGGVADAIELDHLGDGLEEYLEGKDDFIFVKSVRKKPTNANTKTKKLTSKDEEERNYHKSVLTVKSRNRHNEMTNNLLDMFGDKAMEGGSKKCLFDVLIIGYFEKGKNKDLLIEVKSSNAIPDVRMAIGQLYDYHRVVSKDYKAGKAVLIDGKPTDYLKGLVEYAGVGLLWFSGNGLKSFNLD